jgi:hypothetical protein
VVYGRPKIAPYSLYLEQSSSYNEGDLFCFTRNTKPRFWRGFKGNVYKLWKFTQLWV